LVWRYGLGSGDCVRWKPSCPQKNGTPTPPSFWPVYCGQTAGWMNTPLGTEVDLDRDRPHCIRRCPSCPRKGHNSPHLLAHVYCGHGRPSQLLLSSCTNGRPKTVRPMLSDRCPVSPVLSVTLVYCSQTVGRTKMKRGKQVGLDPGHIVSDGNQAPPPAKGHSPPIFGPYNVAAKWLYGSRCQPLGMEVGLSPGDCVRWGPRSSSPKRDRDPPTFDPCLLRETAV